ncbi:rhodanese-like domain-containing protein [Mycobacterium parmense]|uniref:Uncharacterized protein n=1 Tax=Mycobacterium parmense TaxID=185642 RepID=A0A7I7YXQ0_9MYCO|nr:rhodanese-like domain-containing protein [Mycobacterium parmense]MCV7350464.1 rhodanese-like domain-containing protein [Mycobacterium parmense]ORW48196.1 sulfurtransferase [Mycobacterium parmense]BBZ46112.1 hypothetical protein MPRM_33930 [Mycobacterium parmense]
MSYAGDITPEQAWQLLNDDPRAMLVDVRTDAEWRTVGVPDLSGLGREAVFIEWNTSDGLRNEGFADELRDQVGDDERPVIFLCRSGSRSIAAAELATGLGIAPSFNVLDGFEGRQSGTGWQATGLPWKQM